MLSIDLGETVYNAKKANKLKLILLSFKTNDLIPSGGGEGTV